ncbi:MAG: hypothetical protein K0S27_1053 [Gammaproteobacteria bacterium]|jgi:predicted AAA+ superfamily ATPase|nr:hypothetical protein [Gammaproteobacteria bacterium]
MKRPYYINKIASLSQQFPVVCLLGARQVGKTTLAKQFAAKQQGAVHLFDLERDQDIALLENPHLTFNQLEGLIVIDEIQRRPHLFPALRVLVDSSQKNQRWLVLGSASRELLYQSSESLAGRIAYLEIQPFDYHETHESENLWVRGGYPSSYLAKSDENSFEWRRQYIKHFLNKIFQIWVFVFLPLIYDVFG